MNDTQSPRAMRLIVTGGGTGGHTYPALTTVNALRSRLEARDRALEVLWVGAEDSLEGRVATANDIPFHAVATGKIRRSKNPLKLVSPQNIADMGRALRGVFQSRRVVSDARPDVVLATGGYVAVPVGLAARLGRRPLVVHEQTVRLGLANRVLARAGARIAVTTESTLELLPGSARDNAVVTGNPVRPAVLEGDPDRAAAELGFDGYDPELPTVYVTGGAQGSVQINTTVRALLPWLLARANVVHQCGEANVDNLRAATRDLDPTLARRHHVTAFVGPELPDVLALADVVISRSGAGTIAELTALGKAAVFVPLASSAGDEQRHNARHLQEAGAALALLDQVTPEALQEKLGTLLADPEHRATVAERARGHGNPDAADRLVDVVLGAGGA